MHSTLYLIEDDWSIHEFLQRALTERPQWRLVVRFETA
jgi:hypothetical protein